MTDSLSIDASDEEVRGLLRRWMVVLSEQDWPRAAAMLLPSKWNASALQACIVNFGSDVPIDGEPPAFVTDPATAEITPDYPRPQFSIEREHLGPFDPSVYVALIHLDLPIDGYWSDLTARLGLRRTTHQRVALELFDIHVM